jgi:hypothetical protein
VDIDCFLDVVAEVAKEAETSAAAVETADPQPVNRRDEASPEFTKELEMTIDKGEDPVQDVPLIEIHDDLLEGQDPSPSVSAFNKSFGTSYRGELLSVGYEVAGIGDGASKILTPWKSPTLINETRGASK